MNTSEVIAKFLSAAGIEYVFGYPGDPNIEFLEAARREGLAFVLAGREGTAGLMAEAYGQITGLPGVCLSTLGPGSSNLVNAVASAHLDRVPMLAFSGQIETKRQQTFTHQVLDHNRLFAPISKWTTQIQPDTVSAVMRKAIRVALAERPGPVHITTPADVVGAEARDAEIRLPPMTSVEHAIQIAAVDAGAADPANSLMQAAKPIVVAGMSAARAQAHDSLTHFAETMGCPVLVSPMAKGIIAEDHPYFAGTIDMACSDYIWDFLDKADLILAVGFDPVELIKPWQPTAPVIHIDTVPNTDQVYAADIEMVGPIAACLNALTASPRAAAKWSETDVARHREGLASLYYAGRVEGKLNPTDVVDIARAALPRTARVTTDVGSHKLLVGQGWTTYAPGGVLMSNGLSSMGYALPAGITAQLLDRKRPTVTFIGDGGLTMVQGELRLASSLGLDLTVVVFCDNSLNRIELKQMSRQYPSWGTLFEATDIAKLAESMGCEGFNVDSQETLEAALLSKRQEGVPRVIGAVIDPAQYAGQF